MKQDLRSALRIYEQEAVLTRITERVSWEYDTAAVLWLLKTGNAVLFDDIEGYDVRVVGNVLNTRDKLGRACEVPVSELQRFLRNAYHNPQPVKMVAPAAAPSQEVAVENEIDVPGMFPVPKISEHDSGRFITAGIVIANEPVSGRANLAIARLEVKGPDRLGCFLAKTDTHRFLEYHRRHGTQLEVAVAIGTHPVLLAASQLPAPDDELSFAGGMFGEPVEMVECASVDLAVPAHAEIVLEGVIDPTVREPEGPFGEFGGQYNATDDSPVIAVKRVTTRRDPLFQMVVGGTHPEHSIIGAFAREVRLIEAIERAGPEVKAVNLPVGGTCRFQAIVSLEDPRPDDARTAILAALSSSTLLRQVVIVDGDTDVFDRDAVDWAIAAHMDAVRDIVVLERCRSHPRDPGTHDEVATNVGFDATPDLRAGKERRPLPRAPVEVSSRILARLGEQLPGDAYTTNSFVPVRDGT